MLSKYRLVKQKLKASNNYTINVTPLTLHFSSHPSTSPSTTSFQPSMATATSLHNNTGTNHYNTINQQQQQNASSHVNEYFDYFYYQPQQQQQRFFSASYNDRYHPYPRTAVASYEYQPASSPSSSSIVFPHQQFSQHCWSIKSNWNNNKKMFLFIANLFRK